MKLKIFVVVNAFMILSACGVKKPLENIPAGQGAGMMSLDIDDDDNEPMQIYPKSIKSAVPHGNNIV